MSKLSFVRSKRHNLVEVSISYLCKDDRTSITTEIAFLQELSKLMYTSSTIHEHGHTPVEPNITMFTDKHFTGNVHLKFPIKTKVLGSDGLPVAYSYAGLHAILLSIRNICKCYRDAFLNFSVNLNLDAMKAPWTLPVQGKGVILRKGSSRFAFGGNQVPSCTFDEANEINAIDSMMVVGEYRAVQDFTKRWERRCETRVDLGKTPDRGPSIDMNQLRRDWPSVQWHNLTVLVRDSESEMWFPLGSNHNLMNLLYIDGMGNGMLNEPLGYDNDSTATTGNIFLNDHDYYEFASSIA